LAEGEWTNTGTGDMKEIIFKVPGKVNNTRNHIIWSITIVVKSMVWYGGVSVYMAEIKFEITQHIGVLSESAKGWKKELNLISWNDKDPKYDIREWSPDHSKMGKGVTLTEEELKQLRDILVKME
jgi:hypothetical protein